MSKQKQKTHKGTAKRIKITGSGKLMHLHAGTKHFLEKKSTGTKRASAKKVEVKGSIARSLKRAMGVSK